MKTIGIICEYNPFHNGHLYHIKKIKELFPNSTIVLVMSGNVTERGELSILNKWEKTEISIHFGIDLVVELPFVYASQAADIFCYGSIKILSELCVDTIVFGSECDDIDKLKRCAEIQLYNQDYNILVKEYLSNGMNYPTALSKALKEISNIEINTPNDLLGLGYIKEIIKNNYNIEARTIKRTNDYHDININNTISSATSIRNAIINKKDIKNTVPSFVIPFLNKDVYFLKDYFSYIKYKIISEENLEIYQTVDSDIISRMKDSIISSNSLEEFIANIKTKYYTYNKLMRICSHILFSFTKEEANYYFDNPYIRILGFSEDGQKYLNKRKKEINIPIISNYSNDKEKLLYIELRVSKILSLLNKNIFEEELKNKPIKKDV